MKEGCTKAAVNFLISNLLKHVLTKHKKGTETSVNPEEEQGVDDHDESLNFGRYIITCIVQLKMPAFCDLHIFLYMDRIFKFVHIRENMNTILFIYEKIRMRKSPHFGVVLRRGFLTRLPTKISLFQKLPDTKRSPLLRKFTVGRCYLLMNL